MSGALAALILQHGSGSLSRNHELRDHCQRLMAKLQDPYFRIMLSYIVFEDWEEILDEAAMPLRGRLSLALRFLDDKALTTYLRRMTDMCRRTGIIDGLILTGLTPRGMDILQCYVDMTGDIQTAAIVSSLVSPLKWEDLRVGIWVEAYRDLLDGWRLFHYRCQYDIDRGSILQEGMQAGDLGVKEWVPRQFLIRCNYCNKSISPRQEAEPGMSQKQSVSLELRIYVYNRFNHGIIAPDDCLPSVRSPSAALFGLLVEHRYCLRYNARQCFATCFSHR